jgi:hypothetical protein
MNCAMSDLFTEKYYEAARAPRQLPESHSESRLRQVLSGDTLQVVRDAVERWNAPLREAVRSATALKFADGLGRVVANVSVDVVDGMPRPLADATHDVEPWQWWLVLHRPALEQANQGLKLIIDEKDMLANHLADVSARIGAMEVSRGFIAEILARSVEKDILDRFQKIKEDVLGAYWIHASRIQLYWMPLAVFAPLLRVSLATLTVVVLCHEFVHAYTHRGIDLNADSWRTNHFIDTDTYVKEGLAQYYTEQIMRGLGARLPDGLTTFLAKTARQSAPYTTYQNWLGDMKQPSPEATRLAMLEFRNAEPALLEHDKFVELLRSAQARLLGDRSGSGGGKSG